VKTESSVRLNNLDQSGVAKLKISLSILTVLVSLMEGEGAPPAISYYGYARDLVDSGAM